jgi:DegV family protein with EDD domain
MAKQLGIRVVPIYIRFGDKTYRDGLDMSTDEFYPMLTSMPVHPATSQPNPEDFSRAYREYSDSVDGIVSIHISSKLSGTLNSARIAQKSLETPCPIELIDSKLNSAGLGMVVIAAARLAQTGATLSEVVKEAKKAIAEVRMFGMFGTMKYLARSGRVSKTIATVSDILNVMPLLTFRDGEIMRAGLVRTTDKAVSRICEFVKTNMPVDEIAIVHSAVEDRAKLLKQYLSKYTEEEKIAIIQLGAGLGVHGGPGVLLVSLRKIDGSA